jgi:hypothetical protein
MYYVFMASVERKSETNKVFFPGGIDSHVPEGLRRIAIFTKSGTFVPDETMPGFYKKATPKNIEMGSISTAIEE